MTAPRYDFIIVGGGSAGCALANRLSVDPATTVLVLEAGRPDYRFDVFVHMPAALTFPIGSRYYDWGYRSEPEPFMHGRRIYHARGNILGGSSSINGQFSSAATRSTSSAGRPTRAWRHGTTPTACRTSSGWRRASRRRRTTHGAATMARWSSNADPRPTRSSPRSSPPARKPAMRGASSRGLDERRQARGGRPGAALRRAGNWPVPHGAHVPGGGAAGHRP